MSEQRLLDRKTYHAAWYEHLDRALSRPQLAGIGISGCVGAGIFVTSGNLVREVGELPLNTLVLSKVTMYTDSCDRISRRSTE